MDYTGQILVKSSLISQEQLAHALVIQKRNHSRLGDILIAQGIITYLQLYNALAKHYGLEFIDLLQNLPDESLLTIHEIENYTKFRVIPWKKVDAKIIVAVAEYSDESKKWVLDTFGDNSEIVLTSPLDIRRTIERVFGKFLEEESRFCLWKKNPKESARAIALSFTHKFLYILLVATIVSLILLPIESSIIFVTICSIFYGINIIVKMAIFLKGTKQDAKLDWEKLLAELDNASLPVYTILVPMYKEDKSIPKLLAAIEHIDYPAEKLDVKLIFETDDVETIRVAYALKPRHNFEIICVPESTLRTKPKACNYALRFARGEYVTIFDADDIPSILQLKKAIITFRLQPKDVVCLQARLGYYNMEDNMLTRFFALEYSILFDVLLYGLEGLNIPLPLGGTSNHFSLVKLQELGEWDAYNVTEDADLGVRLAAYGFRTVMLDSHTLEEAPNTIPAWIRQRSRWIKGYMQTWLVHMRHPLILYRKLGTSAFWGFQFFIGFSSLSFLTAPILWLLALLWWILPEEITKIWLPDWLIWLTFANLLINFIVHWAMMVYCVSLREKSSPEYKIAALFYPVYLILHSIASYKALYQLITKPHFWEKTTHGVASGNFVNDIYA